MAYVYLAVFLLLASSLTTEAGRRRSRKCEKIFVPECANRGYQRTKFPNPFTKISTQDETNNLTRFLPVLAQLNCTRMDAMPFLCSVYVPVCQARSRAVLPPCREFCEQAIGSCPALAASYGIQWPSPLDCSNYPAKNSQKNCLSELNGRVNKKEKKVKRKPKANETKCCRMGEIAAIKNKTCNLTEAMATTQRKRIMKGLAMCTGYEAKFTECCTKNTGKMQARKLKKQQVKAAKKQQAKAKKQQAKAKKQQAKAARKQAKANRKLKKAQKKARKQGKQHKRKQKKGEGKQKKQNKKSKKGKKKGPNE